MFDAPLGNAPGSEETTETLTPTQAAARKKWEERKLANAKLVVAAQPALIAEPKKPKPRKGNVKVAKFLPEVVNIYATARDDGRAHMVNKMRSPETGRTLTGEFGHAVDELCEVYGWVIPAEYEAIAGVVLAAAILGAAYKNMPAMTVKQAEEKLPTIQAHADREHREEKKVGRSN